ncbi:hypothetical protein J6590_077758 [Homalodisca vitripennis]|nr:hypothetical protein J6590_103257 [Homalodisca vitripennis]KAG8320050.1 hypothetical protein J6590_077758 [Homalodisca vitripennis]
MTRPKGIFKKRTNKGNRFYKRLPSVSPDEDSTVRPRPTTPKVVVPPSSSEKKLGSSDDQGRVKKRRRDLGEEEENDEHYVPGGF